METFIKKTSKYLHEPQQKNLSGDLVSKENGNIVCVQKMAAGSLSFLLYRYGINMGKKKDSNCPGLKVLFLLCKYMLEFRRYTLQCLQNFNSLITFVSHTLMLHSTHAHTHTQWRALPCNENKQVLETTKPVQIELGKDFQQE